MNQNIIHLKDFKLFFFVFKQFLIGLKQNLREEDNLSTRDKWPAPKVSSVRRFYCICEINLAHTYTCTHLHTQTHKRYKHNVNVNIQIFFVGVLEYCGLDRGLDLQCSNCMKKVPVLRPFF